MLGALEQAAAAWALEETRRAKLRERDSAFTIDFAGPPRATGVSTSVEFWSISRRPKSVFEKRSC